MVREFIIKIKQENMFFKVIHNKEVHIYNPKGPYTLLGLKAYIKSAFKVVPQKYHLEYEDIENDLVTLASQDDFDMMVETSNKIVKIFIRQNDEDFYDQTAHVLLDDEKQSLSRKNSEVEEPEKEFIDMTEEPKSQEKQEPVEQPKEEPQMLESIPSSLNESNVSSISQVTEAEIERKFQQMLPDLIGKVKQEILKESVVKSQIKPKLEVKEPKNQVKEEKVIHKDYICDECNVQGIEGIRYKCAICPDFDLCQKCEAKSTHDHPFLKIKHPRHAPIKIFAVMRDDHQDSFEINGQRVPFRNFPYISDMYEAFFGQKQEGECKQGFKVPQFMKGFCPFKKGEKKCEEKPVKEEKMVEEKPVQQKPVPKIEEKKVEEKKIEQKKLSQKESETQRMMLNASYLNTILEIDYNRCYKFAMKNPKLSKQELLDLYFSNTNALV